MARYTGLPDALRAEVFERDAYRCRWCGATNRGLDIHHIEYRRGYSYDRLDNLISLCRLHHGFVHGVPVKNNPTISKAEAQEALRYLLEHPGTTGLAYMRQRKRTGV